MNGWKTSSLHCSQGKKLRLSGKHTWVTEGALESLFQTGLKKTSPKPWRATANQCRQEWAQSGPIRQSPNHLQLLSFILEQMKKNVVSFHPFILRRAARFSSWRSALVSNASILVGEKGSAAPPASVWPPTHHPWIWWKQPLQWWNHLLTLQGLFLTYQRVGTGKLGLGQEQWLPPFLHSKQKSKGRI